MTTRGKRFYQIKATYGYPDDLVLRVIRARRLAKEYKGLPPAALVPFERKLRALSEEDERLDITLAWGRLTLMIDGHDRSNLLY